MPRHIVLASLALVLLALPVAAQESAPPSLPWVAGDTTAPIGSDLAEIDLGSDYIWMDGDGTRQLLQLLENPTDGSEVGTVAPASEAEGWFVVFEWDEMGYVEDSEGDDLDADAMLTAIREATEAANEQRRARGWSTMSIVGWQEPPHYDPQTHNLTWAIIGESAEGRTVNRIVKLLGRRGVMTATVVAAPEELTLASAATDRLLSGYRFTSGNTYAEYVPGQDKLAEYGLTALVVGAGTAALLKSGLLARFWKVIVAGIAALGVGAKRLLGRRDGAPTAPPPSV